MTDFRLNVWVNTGKAAPKLNLPPTSESHKLNVWRAHFLVVRWEACISGELPPLKATQNGYYADISNLCYQPIKLMAQ